MTITPLDIEATVADVTPEPERTFTFTTSQAGAEHVSLNATAQNDIAAHVIGWKPSASLDWCEYVSVNLHLRQPISVQYVRPLSPDSTIVVHTLVGQSWVSEFIDPEHLDAAIDAALARLTGLLACRKQFLMEWDRKPTTEELISGMKFAASAGLEYYDEKEKP